MLEPMGRTTLLAILLAGYAIASAETTLVSAKSQVEAVENAFAKTMADRDHEAFAAFLSEDVVFLSGPIVLRGKEQVAAAWAPYFAGPEPPFSWEPTSVEVLESGDLALSTGPVRTGEGKVVSTFTSIWRQEAPGIWRIVFDQGNLACPPPE